MWHRVLPRLARRHRVYMFDLVGYGTSEEGGDVSLGMQSRLLRALFEYWQLDQPAVLAHDFGGATALRGWILEGLQYGELTLIDPVALTRCGSPFVTHVRNHQEAFAGMPGYAHLALLASYVRGATSRGLGDDDLEPYLTPWLGEVGQLAFYAQIAQMDVDHLVTPERYVPMIETFLPYPQAIVAFTGLCEVAGAAGLMIPSLRRLAGIVLAIDFVSVFPANISNALHSVSIEGLPESSQYYWFRLALQPIFVGLALYVSRACRAADKACRARA